MRAWVTGARGFVGTWLTAHLLDAGDDVVGTGEEVDVTDAGAVRKTLAEVEPEAIYHLAARTHVGRSWEAPEETFVVNAIGTLNIVDAARQASHVPTVLLVSSAEVYGTVRDDELPLTESSPLRPLSPYASSKVAAEYIGLQAYLGSAVPVVRTRSFNHTGPGQPARFAVSEFAKRIVEAQRTGERELRIGNPSPRRDFTDVRDVVRAYRLLVDRGEPGEVYNVCTGTDVAIGDIARQLVVLAGADVDVVVDDALVRPVDVPVLRGDGSKLTDATGWRPAIALADTLRAVLDHWRGEHPT